MHGLSRRAALCVEHVDPADDVGGRFLRCPIQITELLIGRREPVDLGLDEAPTCRVRDPRRRLAQPVIGRVTQRPPDRQLLPRFGLGIALAESPQLQAALVPLLACINALGNSLKDELLPSIVVSSPDQRVDPLQQA